MRQALAKYLLPAALAMATAPVWIAAVMLPLDVSRGIEAMEIAPLVKAAQLVRPLEVTLLTPELQARLPNDVVTFAVPASGKEPPGGAAVVVSFADDAKAIDVLQVFARPRQATLLRVEVEGALAGDAP